MVGSGEFFFEEKTVRAGVYYCGLIVISRREGSRRVALPQAKRCMSTGDFLVAIDLGWQRVFSRRKNCLSPGDFPVAIGQYVIILRVLGIEYRVSGKRCSGCRMLVDHGPRITPPHLRHAEEQSDEESKFRSFDFAPYVAPLRMTPLVMLDASSLEPFKDEG